MTYGEIYKRALEELCLFPGEVEDYRPAVEMHIKQLKEPIPNGIIIWLKNGDKIIYVADSQKEEQEAILDKIRGEIESKIKRKPSLDFKKRERDRKEAFLEVLEILDKCKAEFEAKDKVSQGRK